MPRFKSTLTPEERAPQTLIIPNRVQKIIDLYNKNNVEYPWTQEDRDDQTFEYKKSRRLDTYKYNIARIDRVRNFRGTEEFYFYQMKQSVINDNDVRDESRELTYGFAAEPETKLDYEPRINAKEPKFQRYNPTYFFKWNKEEVRALLEGSDEPCKNFCIGDMGEKGQGQSSASRNVLQLTHRMAEKDFIEGDFDDLVLVAKSPFTGAGSALGLVSRLREEQEKQVLVKMKEQQKKT